MTDGPTNSSTAFAPTDRAREDRRAKQDVAHHRDLAWLWPIWAQAARARGDRVAATARNARNLVSLTNTYDSDVLLTLNLDVTDRQRVFEAVRRAADHFGRLDVIVNNAGARQYGSVEELTELEIRAQMETNFFGALWVTQASLPILRKQRSGHLLQISSIGGVAAFATNGGLPRVKWALEGLSESLAREAKDSGSPARSSSRALTRLTARRARPPTPTSCNNPGPWNPSFTMVGGGVAALTGLVCVALSLNLQDVTKDATHKMPID